MIPAADLSRPRVVDASILPTTFTVNSTADTTDGFCDGTSCTLREAILAANANPGVDTIEFDIAGTPPYIIGVLSDLPDVTEAVTIDGTSEPQFVSTPVVVLDGVATAGPGGYGISIPGSASGSTVRGLCIHRFASHSAILLWNGTSGNAIAGNFIGTDASGTSSVGTFSGIDLAGATGNTIGGTTAADRNLVAGATELAIVLRLGSSGNTVVGNYLGLDVTGTVHLPNVGSDLALFDSSGNTIGGTAAGARNVVAGNSHAEIASVFFAIHPLDPDPNSKPDNNVIAGNFIGTDASGNVALGSASVAVYLQDASNNTIGGVGAAGNVIGASGLGGVRILDFVATASGNQVRGNLIGVGADGVTPLPHASNGVLFYFGASGNTVQDNTIANNMFHGVRVRFDAGPGNRITGNRIFDNGLLGIELQPDELDPGGPTPNDPGDADTGPNDLQNFPVITDLSGAGQVVGTLSSTPNAAFTIEVFQSTSCDPSGFGEAETFVGSGAALTNGAGQATFAVTPLSPLTNNSFLTATATSATDSTSELSACFPFTDLIFTDGFESGDTSEWSKTDTGSP